MNPSICTILASVALLLAAASAQSQTRYTYSSVGDEVTDSKTGLIWRRCSEGQTWSGSNCTGVAATYTHEQALAKAQAQEGTVGWRLPNVKELASIADRTRIGPTIDLGAFPSMSLEYYWSSTPYADGSNYAWHVHFSSGMISHSYRSNDMHVRLVR